MTLSSGRLTVQAVHSSVTSQACVSLESVAELLALRLGRGRVLETLPRLVGAVAVVVVAAVAMVAVLVACGPGTSSAWRPIRCDAICRHKIAMLASRAQVLAHLINNLHSTE